MVKGGHPSVFVVDSYATRPPVQPRLSQGRRSVTGAQSLLFLLVSLALCGMAVEACLIYRLYQLPGTSALSSKLTAGEDDTSRPGHIILPSKPAAHLTDGQDVIHGKEIMAWSRIAEPLLHEMNYKDRCLLIQKEGFYYVYSKVSFFDTGIFHHSVEKNTTLYDGKSIPLLKSRKYSKGSSKLQSNSYLGGVFHLLKDDALFVKVRNTSKIVRHSSFENIFGAYMI